MPIFPLASFACCQHIRCRGSRCSRSMNHKLSWSAIAELVPLPDISLSGYTSLKTIHGDLHPKQGILCCYAYLVLYVYKQRYKLWVALACLRWSRPHLRWKVKCLAQQLIEMQWGRRWHLIQQQHLAIHARHKHWHPTTLPHLICTQVKHTAKSIWQNATRYKIWSSVATTLRASRERNIPLETTTIQLTHILHTTVQLLSNTTFCKHQA